MATYVCLLFDHEGRVSWVEPIEADDEAAAQACAARLTLTGESVGYELWKKGRRVGGYTRPRQRVSGIPGAATKSGSQDS
jgi:hypothetical protein